MSSESFEPLSANESEIYKPSCRDGAAGGGKIPSVMASLTLMHQSYTAQINRGNICCLSCLK